MDDLNRDAVQALLEAPEGRCVSIFMPTHPADATNQRDTIRLKNLLREAERQLGAEAGALEPAKELLNNGRLWKTGSEGLALFAAPSLFRSYRSSLSFPERVVVGDRFYLRPLVPLLETRDRFFILALSLNSVRLFEAGRDRVEEVKLGTEVPGSFEDALGYEQYDSSVQLHTSSSQGLGRRPAIFHGHGDSDADRFKDDILRYFQRVDKGLHGRLRGETVPLVLAAVESHFPLYRAANTYPHLLPEGVAGNPDQLGAKELQARAWERVEPHFLKQREEALHRYRELAGAGRTTSEIQTILHAAYQGRVELLMLDAAAERWGAFDPDNGSFEVREEAREGDEELLNRAAILTLARGGAVQALNGDQMPEGTAAAAILRY